MAGRKAVSNFRVLDPCTEATETYDGGEVLLQNKQYRCFVATPIAYMLDLEAGDLVKITVEVTQRQGPTSSGSK